MRKFFSFFIALMAVSAIKANTYTRVVGVPAEGQYLIAYDDTDSIRVCNITDVAGNFVKAKAIENAITADLDDYVVEVKAVEGGYTFQQVKTGKYIGGRSSGNTLVIASEPIFNTIEYVNNDSLKVVSETRVLLYNATSGQDRFRYFTASNFDRDIYKKPVFFLATTKVEPQGDWKADTISVTTAREYIKNNDPLKDKTHYVEGIVSSDYFGTRWPGFATIWMRDIVNEKDTLEGYKIYKNAKGEDFASLEELGLMVGDTVLLFADGLMLYTDKNIYETTSGYLVSVKRNSSVTRLDITQGAARYDADESVLELSLTTENGEFVITLDHSNAKAIVGEYSFNEETDVTLAGEALTLTDGKMAIAYIDSGYTVSVKLTTAEKVYALQGEGLALGDFPDDIPYMPEPLPEGVLTCAEIYAIGNALVDNAVTIEEYRMRGWVTAAFNPAQDMYGIMQQTAWIADERNAKSGLVKAQYCYFDEEVVKGDYVELVGPLMKYVKDGAVTIEFKTGYMTKLNTHVERGYDVILNTNGLGTVSFDREFFPTDTIITISAQPYWGCEFIQWSDGNTDNPRQLVVDHSITLTAIFKDYRCGYRLIWSLEDGILTISGHGDMYNYNSSYNPAPWSSKTAEITSIVLPDGLTSIGTYAFDGLQNRSFKKLIIPQTVTRIGAYAFIDCNRLTSIHLPYALEEIGDYAFAECTRINDITILAPETPDIYEHTFDNVSRLAYLYVPCENKRAYQLDAKWKDFDIQCIGAEQSETTATDSVVVVPSTNDATITWPSDDNAASYTIEITKDGEVFCRLIFNANGQLTGIAFAPSRSSEQPSRAALAVAGGWQFTVTGLNPGTKYSYEVTTKDNTDTPLSTYTGTFETEGEAVVTGLDDIVYTRPTKLLRDGHLLIQRDGKTYNMQGAVVNL